MIAVPPGANPCAWAGLSTLNVCGNIVLFSEVLNFPCMVRSSFPPLFFPFYKSVKLPFKTNEIKLKWYGVQGCISDCLNAPFRWQSVGLYHFPGWAHLLVLPREEANRNSPPPPLQENPRCTILGTPFEGKGGKKPKYPTYVQTVVFVTKLTQWHTN